MKEMNKELIDNDFEASSVPAYARKGFFSTTIVWLGFVFVITSMMTGGGLASGLTFNEIIMAIFIGNIFLSIIAVAVAYMASKTGLSFALITRYTFGNKGSKIATLFIPVINIGWYTIQAAIYGNFISRIFGIKGNGELIILFLSAVIMGVFSFLGIRAITILGYVAIPAIIFLSIATAIKASMISGMDFIINWQPGTHISVINGITIVIGTWILSTATCIADIMRFAKNTKEAMFSAVIGLLGGNSLLIFCGAISGIGVQNSDLTAVLLKLGLVIPSLILMTTNIFTTNAANLYSSSLNLSNSFKTNRKNIIAIVIMISGALCLSRPYNIDVLFKFLNILGVIVPPLAGIILANYYIIHKRNYPDLKSSQIYDWDLTPWLSWVIALVIVKLLSFVAVGKNAFNGIWGLPALNGIISGIIIYPIIYRIINKRRV